MNERIKELAEQALKSSMVHDGVYRPDGYTNGVSKDFADKFAELIVRECIQLRTELSQFDNTTAFGDGYENGLKDMAELMAEHFGVE